MKMSKGQIGRRWLGLAAAGIWLLAGGAAFAEEVVGQPSPWELDLQASASPVMDSIMRFHDGLLVIITVITLFVLALLITVVLKFNARSNPVPSRTTHNTTIEVAWTLIPVLILVSIAVPSFRLLFEELDIPKADLTVKATGKQWYWSYAYPDNGKFEFDSLLAEDKQPRLLGVDNELVVPVNKVVGCRSPAPTSSIPSRYRRSASRSTPFRAGSTRPGSRPPRPACSTASARNCAAGITPSCRSRCGW